LKNVSYGQDPYETASQADLLLIATEWNEFRNLDMEKLKTSLKQPNIIDGRNIYEPKHMKQLGFNYQGIGR